MRDEAKPTIKSGYRNTYHRDGTISFWNCYKQQWERMPVEDISDEVYASMGRTCWARLDTIREVTT